MTRYDAVATSAAERDPVIDDIVVVERGPVREDPVVTNLSRPDDYPDAGDSAADLAEPFGPDEPIEPDEPAKPAFRAVGDDAEASDEGYSPVSQLPVSRLPVPPTLRTTSAVDGDDQRWHDILVGFIDDPRGSVAEAAELVEADVTALIALLSRRRDALGETWQTEKSSASGTATEDLRLAVRSYRDFSRQIAASLKALG